MLPPQFLTATLAALTVVGTAGLVYATSTPRTAVPAAEPETQAQPATAVPDRVGRNDLETGASVSPTMNPTTARSDRN